MKRLLYLVVFLVVMIALPELRTLTPLVVLSGSMEPYFNPGDIVLIEPVNTSDVQIGDVVAFHPSWGRGNGKDTSRTLYTHRVVGIVQNSTGLYFITKGDNNEENDPTPVLARNVVGRVVVVLPYLGYLTRHNRDRRALLAVYVFFILLPGIYLLVSVPRELLERPVVMRKKERVRLINSRYGRSVFSWKVLVVFLGFLMFFAILLIPSLGSAGGTVVNTGSLPLILISEDLPGYVYLAPGDSCTCNYISAVNAVLPVQWLVALSELPLFPWSLVISLAALFTLISYPIWTSKFPNTGVKWHGTRFI